MWYHIIDTICTHRYSNGGTVLDMRNVQRFASPTQKANVYLTVTKDNRRTTITENSRIKTDPTTRSTTVAAVAQSPQIFIELI